MHSICWQGGRRRCHHYRMNNYVIVYVDVWIAHQTHLPVSELCCKSSMVNNRSSCSSRIMAQYSRYCPMGSNTNDKYYRTLWMYRRILLANINKHWQRINNEYSNCHYKDRQVDGKKTSMANWSCRTKRFTFRCYVACLFAQYVNVCMHVCECVFLANETSLHCIRSHFQWLCQR